MDAGVAYNCVFGADAGASGAHLYQATSYNCTFIGKSSRSGNTYNAIVLGNDGDLDKMYNCYYVNKNSGTTADENCVKTNAAALALDADFRPVWSNVAINAGLDASYPSFPSALSSERTKDFHGAPRMIGTIDVGACEFDWRTLPTTSGLEFTLEAVEGGERLRVWRNFTSDTLVKGFSYGDETVMFEGLEGGVWETNVTGQAIANSLAPIYETNQTDWYVNPDPLSGASDLNDGFTTNTPKLTLAGVLSVATNAGDIVNAYPGTYDSGEMFHNAEATVAARGCVLIVGAATFAVSVTVLE